MRIYLLKPGEIHPPLWYGVSRYSTLMVEALHRLDPALEFVSSYFSLRGRVPQKRRAILAATGVRLTAGRWPDLSAVPAYQRMLERLVVPRLVDRAGCDLVWGTNCVTLRRGRRRFRTAVTIHDLFLVTHPELSESRFTRFVAPRLERTAQEADVILTDSRFTAAQITELLGAAAEKVTVTHLGPSPAIHQCPYDRPADVLDELGLDEAPILSVGTVEPRKNYQWGLNVYRLLEKHLGAAPPWAIVGRDGWKFEAFYKERERLGLDGRVRVFRGVSDDRLSALYRAARCLFCPSLVEGFGLAVLEAMSAGLPVVCSTGGSLPEVGGDAVLSAAPDDNEAMSAALERALTDSALAADMVRRGYAQSGRFSWQEAARKAHDAFRRAVG